MAVFHRGTDMSQSENRPSRRPYEPPSITRVHVDPVKELLLATACGFFGGENQPPACQANPGT
jgi:hypothetical protein